MHGMCPTNRVETVSQRLSGIPELRVEQLIEFDGERRFAAALCHETYQEVQKQPFHSYNLVFPTLMPVPVIKLGGEVHRGRSAETGGFSIGTPHHDGHWVADGNPGSASLKLYFSEAFVADASEIEFGHSDGVTLLDVYGVRDPFVTAEVRKLSEAMSSGNVAMRLFLESSIQTLVEHLVRHYSTGARKLRAQSPSLSAAASARVEDYIRTRIGDELTLEDLAAVAGLSPHHFLRCFKQSAGRTPHQFVIEQRVDKCRQLLKDRDRSLAEIAYECGFSSQSHMTTAFRNRTGITPGNYRRTVNS